MTENEKKTWRESLQTYSYSNMLSIWRHASLGDERFVDEKGKIWKEVMDDKKSKLTHDEQVQASKNVGW